MGGGADEKRGCRKVKSCHKVREQIERWGEETGTGDGERVNMQTGKGGGGGGERRGGKVRERCSYG